MNRRQEKQSVSEKALSGDPLKDEKRFSRRFLLVLAVFSTLAFLYVIRVFATALVLSVVFAALFYPLYEWILRGFKGRKRISSIAACLVLFLGLVVPVLFISNLLALQALEFYQTVAPWVSELIRRGDEGFLGRAQEFWFLRFIDIGKIDWQGLIQESANTIGRLVGQVINATSRMTLSLVINLFIILYSLFFLFKDGDYFVKKVKYFFPMSEEYKDALISRFVSISRATVKGTLLIGMIQGSLGGLTLLIFGVSTWLLWAIIMVVLSVIPVLGSWMVLVPAGVIMIVQGNVWQGIAVIFISTFIVSTIDNILRPRLVSHEAGMHDLLIFFSTIGGLAAFGVMGFIIGPVIAALFLTVLDIYGREFEPQLTYSKGGQKDEKPEKETESGAPENQ